MIANHAPAEPRVRVIRGFRPKGMFENEPDLLSVQNLKRLTGQSEQTIRGLISSGALPGCRIGRRLYVPKPAFVEYVTNGGGMDGR